jgi:hypothetical protein
VRETKAVDRKAIPRLQKRGVAPEFRELDWEDLATVSLSVVLQKPVG